MKLGKRIVAGSYAWGGILQNARVVANAVGEQVEQHANQAAQNVSNRVTQAVQTVEDTARNVVEKV